VLKLGSLPQTLAYSVTAASSGVYERGGDCVQDSISRAKHLAEQLEQHHHRQHYKYGHRFHLKSYSRDPINGLDQDE